MSMFKTIIVGADGSEHGNRALEVASELARANGSRVVVVHVTELVGGKGGSYPESIDEDEIRARIAGQVAELAGKGIQAEFRTQVVTLGGPARVIAEHAAAEGGDLIIVGTRGRSAVAQIVLGSVAVRLLHLAHCPVLVLPAANG